MNLIFQPQSNTSLNFICFFFFLLNLLTPFFLIKMFLFNSFFKKLKFFNALSFYFYNFNKTNLIKYLKHNVSNLPLFFKKKNLFSLNLKNEYKNENLIKFKIFDKSLKNNFFFLIFYLHILLFQIFLQLIILIVFFFLKLLKKI